jgi:hypothetical protein
MKKYMIMYMMPVAGMEEWAKVDPEKRKTEEDRLRGKWQEWMQTNAGKLDGPAAGLGKNKRVTKEGVADMKNDMMLYSIIKADSQEDAAHMMEGHPHLEIPGAWIEVMEINQLPGMQS